MHSQGDFDARLVCAVQRGVRGAGETFMSGLWGLGAVPQQQREQKDTVPLNKTTQSFIQRALRALHWLGLICVYV